MFLLSNSSMFLHPAITAHLVTSCSARTRESAVAINLPEIPPPSSPVYLPRVEVNLAAVPRLLRTRRVEMECALQFICEAEALEEAITHQQRAGARPSMA